MTNVAKMKHCSKIEKGTKKRTLIRPDFLMRVVVRVFVAGSYCGYRNLFKVNP